METQINFSKADCLKNHFTVTGGKKFLSLKRDPCNSGAFPWVKKPTPLKIPSGLQ